MAQALEGIRILDLTGGIAGPLGVLQLAEHGADVIKVEPPGGSRDRQLPGGLVYDRNRRSVTSSKSTRGREIFSELCDGADVLVEAFAARNYGRAWPGIRRPGRGCPRPAYCSVPAWPTGTRYDDRPAMRPWYTLARDSTGRRPHFGEVPISPQPRRQSGRLLPGSHRDHVGPSCPGAHRPGPARRSFPSAGRLSRTTQIWNWTDKGQFLLPKTQPP